MPSSEPSLEVKPLAVRQFLNALVQVLKDERDQLPEGSIGAKRLFEEVKAVNETSMVIARRYD